MTEAAKVSQFDIRKHLDASLVCTSLKATTKQAVIDELLALLDARGLLSDAEVAKQSVMAREASMSTGMQHGLALPHGKTSGVDELVCAVGLKKDGIDFDSLDGELSTVFVLMLSPTGESEKHLQFMSAIGRVMNGTGAERVLACDSAEDIVSILSQPAPARNGQSATSP